MHDLVWMHETYDRQSIGTAASREDRARSCGHIRPRSAHVMIHHVVPGREQIPLHIRGFSAVEGLLVRKLRGEIKNMDHRGVVLMVEADELVVSGLRKCHRVALPICQCAAVHTARPLERDASCYPSIDGARRGRAPPQPAARILRGGWQTRSAHHRCSKDGYRATVTTRPFAATTMDGATLSPAIHSPYRLTAASLISMRTRLNDQIVIGSGCACSSEKVLRQGFSG
jgi:hypothetical protein